MKYPFILHNAQQKQYLLNISYNNNYYKNNIFMRNIKTIINEISYYIIILINMIKTQYWVCRNEFKIN